MNPGSLLWAFLLPAHAADVLPEGVLQDTLSNGLTVVAVPLPSALVAVQVWVSVGSRHEVLPGTTGYAHFFEHLMFGGSEGISAEEREARMLSLSAIDNAWTSNDHTCYVSLAPAHHLDAMLALEADRFQSLALTPSGVAQESGAVMGELRKDASNPSVQVSSRLWSLAYTAHTYQHTPIGLEEDVLAMAGGYETARAFYEAHYSPERVTIVVAGGVEPSDVVAGVRAHFSDWSPTAGPSALPLAEPVQEAARRDHIAWSGADTPPRMSIGWKGPAFSPDEPDSAALSLVSSMLSGPPAPLRRRLIEETELAWSMWSQAPRRVDPGLLTVSVRMREGTDPAVVEAEIEAAIVALRQVSPAELAEAQAWARRALLLSLDDPASWAGTIGWYAAQGWGSDGIERYLDTLMALTPDDIQGAIDRWLVSSNKTVVTLSTEEAP